MNQTKTGTLGTAIREARERLGLSQRALAERAGVSLSLIPKLERDEVRAPHRSTLRSLGDALGLEFSFELVGRAVAEPLVGDGRRA